MTTTPAAFSIPIAGHLSPILLQGQTAVRLEANGTVVGMFPDFPYEQTSIDLQSGDLLVAFTDGITESEDRAGDGGNNLQRQPFCDFGTLFRLVGNAKATTASDAGVRRNPPPPSVASGAQLNIEGTTLIG